MDASDLALLRALPSNHPFRAIRESMVQLYVDHGTELQKRAFHAFLVRINDIPSTQEDWRVFAVCDQPSVLGTTFYQAITLFWAKIAEMLARIATAEEAKELIQTKSGS